MSWKCSDCGYPHNLDTSSHCFKCNSAKEQDTQPVADKPIRVVAPQQKWHALVGIAVALLAFFSFAFSVTSTSKSIEQGQNDAQGYTSSADYTPSSSSHEVTYEVTGTARSASVTYQNGSGGTSQEADMAVPWRRSFNMSGGDFLYISAQNQGEYGSVVTTIYVDGALFKTSTSSGAYVIADASGSL